MSIEVKKEYKKKEKKESKKKKTKNGDSGAIKINVHDKFHNLSFHL